MVFYEANKRLRRANVQYGFDITRTTLPNSYMINVGASLSRLHHEDHTKMGMSNVSPVPLPCNVTERKRTPAAVKNEAIGAPPAPPPVLANLLTQKPTLRQWAYDEKKTIVEFCKQHCSSQAECRRKRPPPAPRLP